jgi:hypothetical protein
LEKGVGLQDMIWSSSKGPKTLQNWVYKPTNIAEGKLLKLA